MLRELTISTALLVTAAVAQDPPVPPGGFPIQEVLDRPITYSDGYKTAVDVRYPSVAPGPRGWPVLMIFHGGNRSRKVGWAVSLGKRMARRGYVTIAYDTGNNGVTKRVNPPGRRSEVDRMRDIAEMHLLVERSLGAAMDEDRLSCFGKSGGGKHTMWATAYSGTVLPKPSAWVTRMPAVMAAHMDIQVLNLVEDMVPQESMFKADFALGQFEHLGPSDPLVRMIIAGDYAGVVRFLKTDPGLWVLPELARSDVPLFVSYAYDDSKHFVNTNADTFGQLKPGVPRRYYQNTGGHGAVFNRIEDAMRFEFTERWCDRFLKNVPNGVDQEPFAEIAVVPASPADYLNAQAHWQHRTAGVWPPRTPQAKLYLRAGGRLAPQPPAAAEAGPMLRHRVAAGYDIVGFFHDKGGAAVLNKIPLVSLPFDGAPLPEPREIFGRTVVSLDIVTSAPSFQMQAALYDVPPSGTPRFVTSGVTARHGLSAGRHRVEIELGDVAYVVARGHRLRVALENLSLERQPQNAHIYTVPSFQSADLVVQIDAVFPPRACVPLREPQLAATPRLDRQSAASGVDFDVELDGTTLRAGDFYYVFVSGSGTGPGLDLPPRIPLNPDIWTLTGIALVNMPVFSGFLGRLDAGGRAKASFRLPPAVAADVVGVTLSFAALGFASPSRVVASNAAELRIDP